MIRRNTASQVIYLPALLLTADGSAVTTGATLTVAKDGTESASAGTLAHSAGGVWKYTPTQGETDCAIVGLVLTATSATPVVLNLVTTAVDTSVANVPANVTQFGGANGTFSGGRPEVNASHWGGTAVASANVLIDGAITAPKIAAAALNGKGDWLTLENVGEGGSELIAIPWNAAWDAEVQSECTDALNAYDGPTKAEQDAAFTEIKGTGWSSSTDTLAKLKVDTAVARSAGVVQIGIISNAGTSVESYTYGGQTVTFAGLDTSGNRSGVTVT